MGDAKGALEDLDKAIKLQEAAEQMGFGAALRAQGGNGDTAADCYQGGCGWVGGPRFWAVVLKQSMFEAVAL